MATFTKLLKLEIDYELKDESRRDKDGKINPYSFLTRNLINAAFQQNHAQGMERKVRRTWRSIRKQLDQAIDVEKKSYVILPESDFSQLYDEVTKCNYVPSNAVHSPYFEDELDVVKARSEAEEEKVQRVTREFEETMKSKSFEPGDVVKEKIADIVSAEKKDTAQLVKAAG